MRICVLSPVSVRGVLETHARRWQLCNFDDTIVVLATALEDIDTLRTSSGRARSRNRPARPTGRIRLAISAHASTLRAVAFGRAPG